MRKPWSKIYGGRRKKRTEYKLTTSGVSRDISAGPDTVTLTLDKKSCQNFSFLS